jgi:hypothetical protein
MMNLFQVATSGAHVSGAVGQQNLQVILAVAISKGLQVMRDSKASWLQWINPDTPGMARLLAAASSFLVASGIAISHTGTFNSSEGLSITIVGLSLAGLIHGISTFLTQWIYQHVSYEAIWKPLNSKAPAQAPPKP